MQGHDEQLRLVSRQTTRELPAPPGQGRGSPRSRSTKPRWFKSNVLRDTGDLILLAGALIVAIWLSSVLAGLEQRPTKGMAPAVPAPTEAIPQEQALADILSLFARHPGFTLPQSETTLRGLAAEGPAAGTGPLASALSLGLVLETEVPAAGWSGPTTRAEFALWVWRGWSQVLPAGPDTPPVTDREGLSPQELRAVEALVALKIMEPDIAGAFRPGDSLTNQEEAEALARLQAILEDG